MDAKTSFAGMVLTVLLLSAASLTPSSAAVPEEDEYVFSPNTDQYVGIELRGALYIGKLDDAGTFIPDSQYKPVKAGHVRISGPAFRVINGPLMMNRHVYEYHSGRLVRGMLDMDGHF